MTTWWPALAGATAVLLGALLPVAWLFGRTALRACALGSLSLVVLTVATYPEDSGTCARDCSTDQLFVDRLDAIVARTVGPVLGVENPFVGVVTLVALAFLCLWAYRGLDRLSTRKDPITVEVGTFRDAAPRPSATRSAPTGSQAGTLLRAALSQQLLTRAQVPGPRGPRDLPGLLETLNPKDASWVGKVAAYLAGLANPVNGWTIEGAVVVGERPRRTCGVVVEASSRRNGGSVFVATYWAASWDEVLDEAAHDIIARALAACDTIPSWLRWRSQGAAGLRAYHEGIAIKASGSGGDQLERQAWAFGRAQFADPGNGLAALELAYTLEARARELDAAASRGDDDLHRESADCRLRALRIYATFSRRHRQFIQARYRLAIALQHPDRFQAASTEATARTNEAVRAYVDEWVGRRFTHRPPAWPDAPDAHYLVELALAEFRSIQRDLNRLTLAWWCIRREHRSLFLRWLLLSRERQRAKASVKTAVIAAELSQLMDDEPDAPVREDDRVTALERRMRRVLRRGNRASGLPAYNAACFYALMIAPRPRVRTADWERTYERVATRSVELLSKAVRNRREAYPSMSYIRDDADLDALRRHPRFVDWWESLGGTLGSRPPKTASPGTRSGPRRGHGPPRPRARPDPERVPVPNGEKNGTVDLRSGHRQPR